MSRAFSSCSSGFISGSKLCAPELELSVWYKLGNDSFDFRSKLSLSSFMITWIGVKNTNYLRRPIDLNESFAINFSITLWIIVSQWNVVIAQRHFRLNRFVQFFWNDVKSSNSKNSNNWIGILFIRKKIYNVIRVVNKTAAVNLYVTAQKSDGNIDFLFEMSNLGRLTRK